MDLVNYTPYPALLTRFGASPDVMGSALVTRVTYDIHGTKLVPSAEQCWSVSPKPWECPYGPMEADEGFYKGGTDLLIFASARSPRRRPVSQMVLHFEMGSLRRELVVFGARAWLPRDKSPVASAPQPFVEMPLTMQNAFGGSAAWDGLKVPCADNPNGKGFYLEMEQALGQALPNVEDPSRLIRRWTDRPVPAGVGICPLAFSTRLMAGASFTEKGALTGINGRLFNAAFPEMVAEQTKPGDRVRLTGVSHDGEVTFDLPDGPSLFRLRFGNQQIVRSPLIDQVGVEADAGRVFITYRYPFRYVLYARQRRSAELVLAS